MKTAYKFLVDGLHSQYDGSPWEIGKWRVERKPEKACEGLNASRLIPDALGFVQGTTLARVEYGGKVIDSGNKVTCEKMRLIMSWSWTPQMSVKLAIYAAKLVLHLYTDKYPNDDRPEKAIQAAQDCLGGKITARAAYAAADAAAGAANAAADAAAGAANEAADAAAGAAYAAAYAAADAVNAAAGAAYAAAYAAADAADKSIKRKIHLYALRLVKEESCRS